MSFCGLQETPLGSQRSGPGPAGPAPLTSLGILCGLSQGSDNLRAASYGSMDLFSYLQYGFLNLLLMPALLTIWSYVAILVKAKKLWTIILV